MQGIIPLSIMALMHFWTGVVFVYHKDYPMALIFGSYCLATIGFIWGLK